MNNFKKKKAVEDRQITISIITLIGGLLRTVCNIREHLKDEIE